jgi:peptide chain release factor subunit 1
MIDNSTLRRITGFQGNGLPVLSVYLTIPPQREEHDSVHPRTHDLLAQLRDVAKDKDLPHDVRVSVRDDIARIDADAVGGWWKPPGVAVFACSGREFYEVVQLPRSTRERVVLDDDAWIRPLVAILDEDHPTCIALVDRKAAQLWMLRQDELAPVRAIDDPALRKPNYAGWYGLEERRVMNKAEELAKRHFLKVGRTLEQLLDTDGYELVAVGGHEQEIPPFLDYLPRRVRERLAGTFTVDAATATRAEIREKAQAVIDRFEEQDEALRVAEALERAAAHRPAAIGLRDCLWAGTVAAIQDLLVQDDVTVPGVVCPACGWLAESGQTCPIDGSATRATPDVLDELVETVIDENGSVEHVRSETPLREHVVVATLRFPLPPLPSL